MNNEPYDETNSSNPWLINKARSTPISDDQGNRLTAEYIWSKQGKDREKLVDWVFKYYRSKGFPLFKLTDAQIKTEFKKLCDKDPAIVFNQGTLKNSNITGLSVAKHFTSDLFIKARERNGESCYDVFHDDELFKKVLKNRMGWCSTSEDGSNRPYIFAIDDAMIFQGMRSSRIAGSISHFKPMIAKFVYDRYKAKKTIDFSAGWAARCVAALSSDVEYYGIDPFTSDLVNKTIKYFNGKGRCVKSGSETFDYSQFPNVDICFSSPPYFDIEIYSDDVNQSSQYSDYQDWLDYYWKETVKRCYEKTKYFSFLAVNQVRKFDLLEDMCEICEGIGGELVESLPVSVAKGHLSGKRKTGKVKKKTEFLVVYKV